MSIERSRVNETSYSDVVIVKGSGTWIHVAGQLAFDEQRQLIGDNVTTQAMQCLDRIHRLLTRSGGGLEDVVSITVYLTDLADYPLGHCVPPQR
jgi:enamine deaminase RidA (YjgF/YER057c/UK114 family)